ncbi:FkbM family methyltransferase [uncultured Brachyspira sp.]|nr:FkbM family methyltransferase [uncultured Brachyspira sp.]
MKVNQKELKTIEVNSITFDDLMSKNYPDIKHIDFLLVDIEGG